MLDDRDYTRYRFFVQVDEECLRSVVEQPEDPGWVYLVRCEEGLDYNQSPEELRDVEEYKKQLVNEEDCDAEDCILLSASSLGLVCYVDLSFDLVSWYVEYSQPPNLVVWR
ncbi:hypothetical protein NLG97_g10500 [Lecanicillium saksenae]|uniref:Uncharacterized protein n=1 Tax=Lecanicillium saksenae TaxID=468837 RepID=A0ACC1QEB9_9HYPO|nr:hypothetical protein NLG97_g10500 [Lecanicillium saksenae]